MDDVYLVEFEKLKDEQIARIAHRDRLFHLTIILLGGGLAIAYQNGTKASLLLLLLPAVSYIAGMSHLACNRRIAAIGTYLQSVLAPKIAKASNLSEHEVFLWEAFVRNDPHRPGHIWTESFTFFLLYIASGCGAIALYVANATHPLSIWEVCGCLCGGGLMATLLVQMWSNFRSHYEGEKLSISRLVRPVLGVAASLVAGVAVAVAIIQYGGDAIANSTAVVAFPGIGVRFTYLQGIAAISGIIVWSIGLLSVRR